jgi:hypothetical protein
MVGSDNFQRDDTPCNQKTGASYRLRNNARVTLHAGGDGDYSIGYDIRGSALRAHNRWSEGRGHFCHYLSPGGSGTLVWDVGQIAASPPAGRLAGLDASGFDGLVAFSGIGLGANNEIVAGPGDLLIGTVRSPGASVRLTAPPSALIQPLDQDGGGGGLAAPEQALGVADEAALLRTALAPIRGSRPPATVPALAHVAVDRAGRGLVVLAGAAPPPTPTPTGPQGTCTPRPPVTIQTARTAVGQLSVVVTATTLPATPSNGLRRIRFERLKNALVTIRTFTDQQTPFVVELPDYPRQVAFSVSWKTPAVFTVNFTVEDDCAPPWRTFVGASPQAF